MTVNRAFQETFHFQVEDFIREHVTKRKNSMFYDDLTNKGDELKGQIEGRTVLVIGGAGSIGNSFIKAVLPYEPKELCIVDTNENALAELTRDMRSSGISVPPVYLAYPMDYASPPFRRMFCSHKRRNGMHGFDIVANFAAHKHVRSERDIYSIEALLRNNVVNVKSLLDLLEQFPPEVYFCVSTDKAANPVNFMGASKRIMEDLAFSYSGSFPVKTARFANVAFSNGSLLDGFLKRIEKLQPLSAPSDVKRYFVSPEESGQICLLAAIVGKNREIFFPKLEKAQMGSFDYIARRLLEVYGYKVLECRSEDEAVQLSGALTKGGRQYPVCFRKSDTSGEKLSEEFYTGSESIDVDRFCSLGVITGKKIPDRKQVFALLAACTRAFEDEKATKKDIVRIIKQYIPDFNHIETGKSLDEKM